MRAATTPPGRPAPSYRPPARLAALVAAAAWLVACDGTGMPSDAPSMRRGVGPASAAPPAAPPATAPARAPVSPSAFREGPAPTEAIAEAALEAPAAEPQRDLAGELVRAFGAPTGCFDVDVIRANAPRLVLSVGAHVSTTGLVTRADVTGGALPEEVRGCLVRHAEGLSFQGPVPEAPRRVTARVVYDLQAPPPPAPVERPEWKLPDGAQTPGLALPARVGEGPAPGSVAASTTLPAQAGDGPAPGSVSPGIVLPAQGGTGSSVAIGE